jgi:hypothetical protein
MKLSLSQLRERLHYDPETGEFTRLAPVKGYKPGQKAGCVNKNGYICLTVAKNRVYAHRLAVFYMTGEWPTHDVDHINGNPADNRWSNLRLATRAQNMWNVSGASGAYFQNGRWFASIKVNGVKKSLGGYSTKEEAAAAYTKAKRELHGEFARTA